MLLSLVEADQHLQIYDCFMVKTMSVINFIVVCEENTAPIKKANVFLTLLMMRIYDPTFSSALCFAQLNPTALTVFAYRLRALTTAANAQSKPIYKTFV